MKILHHRGELVILVRRNSDTALTAILHSPRYSWVLRHKAVFLRTEDVIILLGGESCDYCVTSVRFNG